MGNSVTISSSSSATFIQFIQEKMDKAVFAVGFVYQINMMVPKITSESSNNHYNYSSGVQHNPVQRV